MSELLIKSILLGIALAMDAFSISLAAGLNEPRMIKSKMVKLAGTFGLFQMVMPITGWFCVKTIADLFQSFRKFIPWIAFFLLIYIGGKMLLEGISNSTEDEREVASDGKTLFILGVATSIDALSVGFTMAEYDVVNALIESLIIGGVTFMICLSGVKIGALIGTKLSGKASILGGVILIAIGLEIFIRGIS